MDKSRTRPAHRRHATLAPCPEHLEARRLMAARAAQIQIQESSTSGGTLLTITGTNKADIVDIVDNGTGQAGNITVTQANGASYTSKGAVSIIQFVGKAGNDQLRYTLTGDLVAPRNVLATMGAGNDVFTANINGAVNNSSGLGMQVYGDAGSDQLTVNQRGPVLAGSVFPYLDGGAGNDAITYAGTGDISAGASVSPGISGGAGQDTINATYTGVINGNYIHNLAIDGGAGNDHIVDNVNVKANSTGTVGASSNTPAVVQGGSGQDDVRFAVIVDPAATQAQVNAYALGGTGKDVVQRTSNVHGDKSNETDRVIS